MAVPGGGSWEGWGVLSKLVRPPIVVPGGGGWGGLGYPVQTRRPPQRFLEEAAGEGWGVLSKLERPPWQFLGEAAQSIGVSGLNWRDPHGGSWGRWLGGLGCPV